MEFGFFQRQKGFTLVEMAIVLTIIGLLIGGVIKGYELVRNAQNTATIAQVNAYMAALNTFRDSYGLLPGDMSVAQLRLPRCTAATQCFNGNGNGTIGVNALPANQWYIEDQSAVNTENTQIWRHLMAAELIGDVVFDSATPAWSNTHPSTRPSGGGFQLTRGASPTVTGKYYLRLQVQVSGQPVAGAGLLAISPTELSKIDRKIDDASPFAGIVIGNNFNDPGTCVSAAGAYISTSSNNCLAFFELSTQ